MGSGRNTVPLFDLLSNRQGDSAKHTSAAKPTVRIDLQPAHTPPTPVTRQPIYKEPAPTPADTNTQTAPQTDEDLAAPTFVAVPPAAPASTPSGVRFSGPLIQAADDEPAAVSIPTYPSIELEAKPTPTTTPAQAAATPARKPLPTLGSYERPQQPSLKPLIAAAAAILVIVGLAGYVIGAKITQWKMEQPARVDPNTAVSGVQPNTPNSLSDALSNPPAKPVVLQQGKTPTPTPTPTQQQPKPIAPAPIAATLLPTEVFTSADPKVLLNSVITAKGLLAEDPRIGEKNYLNVVSLKRPDAESAIKFLTANGLESFAIPVDPKSSLAKNLDPSKAIFRVYLAQGFTRAEYGEQQRTRDKMQRDVAKLGTVWQKELKGTSNLGSSTWEKYIPNR